MKVLVVYYSRTGNTKLVSDAIARSLNADVEEIYDKKNRAGVFGFLISGYEALFHKHPEISPIKNEPDKYDLVIIGSPTWAGRISSPVRTYATRYGRKLKKCAFFTTCSASGDKVFSQLKELTATPVATLEIKEKEIKSAAFIKKVEEYIEQIKDRLSGKHDATRD